MKDEFNALIANRLWVLFLKLPEANIVCSMWLFHKKYKSHAFLERYKARVVANGKIQQPDIETFSPVVKPVAIHTVLSLVVSRKWPIHHLDVKNAFFHGQLNETIHASASEI